MKKSIVLLILVISLCTCNSRSDKKNDQKELKDLNEVASECKKWNGKIFTFLPEEGMDVHLFTLKFNCVEGELGGVLLGPDLEGEHGLFFFKASLNDINIDTASNVMINYKMGELYRTQITLENYQSIAHDSSGFSRTEFKLKGQIIGDSELHLLCSTDDDYGCSFDTLVFKLNK